MISPSIILAVALPFIGVISASDPFQAYWNVNDVRCRMDHGMSFDFSKAEIIYNSGNDFNGDKVNIIYKPGNFPWYDSNDAINEGIPQLGNIQSHLTSFMSNLTDPLGSAQEGPLVLEFGKYSPRYQSAASIYKQKSDDLVELQNPTFTTEQIKEKAAEDFYNAAKPYFESLLNNLQVQKPNTLYGFFEYPLCSNTKAPCNACWSERTTMNTLLESWMYNKVKALYPSMYAYKNGDQGAYRNNVVITRMKESNRINVNNVPIIPYIDPLYKDTKEFLKRSILLNIMYIIKYYGGSGVVIWSSYYDVNSESECNSYKSNYDDVLSPAVQCMREVSDEFIQVLKHRFPISSDESFAMPPNSEATQQTIEGYYTSGQVNQNSNDQVYIGRRIISLWCKDNVN